MKEKRQQPERRRKFTERVSIYMVVVAGLGALLVLVDLRLTWAFENGITFAIGGEGFSDQLKGVIIGMILVAGFNGVKEYWLGASASGQIQQESMSRIAEGSSHVELPKPGDSTTVEAAKETVKVAKETVAVAVAEEQGK